MFILPIFGQSKCFPNYDVQKCVMSETFHLSASTVIGKDVPKGYSIPNVVINYLPHQ